MKKIAKFAFPFSILITVFVTIYLFQSIQLLDVQAQTFAPGYPAPQYTPTAALNKAVATKTIDEAAAYPAPEGTPQSPATKSNYSRPPDPVITWDKKARKYLDAPGAKVIQITKAQAEKLGFDKGESANSDYLNFSPKRKVKVVPGIDAAWEREVGKGGSSPVYSIVQFAMPMTGAAQRELMAAGVKFYDYINGGGAICQVPSKALPTIRKLIMEGGVITAGLIPQDVRLSQELYDKAIATPEEQIPVNLILFENPTPQELQQVSQFLHNLRQPSLGAFQNLSGLIRAGDARHLSNLSFVRWIEISHPIRATNFEGRMAVGSDLARYWEANGSGVNIGILDSGISQDHTGFQSSRILDQYDYMDQDGIADDVSIYGHGTHVAGIAAGNDPYNTAFIGHAPLANLLIYKITRGSGLPWDGYAEIDYVNALTRGASYGMNVVNMSFGASDLPSVYDTFSYNADRAVRGEFNNQPITVVVAAGNQGAPTPIPDRIIGPPATAKNVITVGAVKEGSSPVGYETYDNCVDDLHNWPPAISACFSAYGPIDSDIDGYTRVKPDLVAPGVGINSTYPWERDQEGQAGWDGVQDGYHIMDGTSMAAPAVTGIVASMLSVDHSTWMKDWPELVKAMLIASAVDLGNREQYGYGLVNAAYANYGLQGIATWRLIDTGAARYDPNPYDQDVPVDTFQFTVTPRFSKLRAVLAFNDPTGISGYGETSTVLRFRIFPNANCSGDSFWPYGYSADDTVLVVDYTPTTPPNTEETWCIMVDTGRYYEDAYGPATYGITVFVEELAPQVVFNAETDSSSAFPGKTFSIETEITNWGNVVAGSYISLHLPHYGQDFHLVGAEITASDGTYHFYLEHMITGAMVPGYDGYIYNMPTGMVFIDRPRKVRWIIEVPEGTPYGQYDFEAEAAYETKDGRVNLDPAYVTIDVVPIAGQAFLPSLSH